MKKMRKLLLYFLGLPKTILFNLKYLSISQAVKLPVFVSHRVWLMDLSGELKINTTGTGAIKIGFGEVGIFDQHRSRTIWQVSGCVEFKGKARIGHGSKLSVTGSLVLGNNFCMTAESSIIACSTVTIGDNVAISWDSLIMDTDHHRVYDSNGNRTNLPVPIRIGNKVWVGCRVLILKGVCIPDGSIVAASTILTKSIKQPNSIIGGNPARVIKKNVEWSN